MVDAVGVEERGAALDAVDLVALLEQELGEVRAVLAGDAGDECFLPGVAFFCVDCLSRSTCAETIRETISSKLTVGCQPRTLRALPLSATVVPGSSGRTSCGSLTTLSRQSRPTLRYAVSQSSARVWSFPVPMTKSSALSCCSMSHIART